MIRIAGFIYVFFIYRNLGKTTNFGNYIQRQWSDKTEILKLIFTMDTV